MLEGNTEREGERERGEKGERERGREGEREEGREGEREETPNVLSFLLNLLMYFIY